MSAELREFIVEHFSRDELLTFCADYFRDFYEDYAGSPISKSALARDLIDHCEHRDLLPALRANLQTARPAPFAARFGRVTVSPVLHKPRDPRRVLASNWPQAWSCPSCACPRASS